MAQAQVKPSISSHELFPAIVAVWFATLFGLGFLVLPPVLLERAADASHIAALVPAAAPPLGLTAHILLSSVAGVFGAVLGFAIARRVATAQTGERPIKAERPQRSAQPKLEARRAILTMEELGEAPIAPTAQAEPEIELEVEQPALLPGRKRRLALDEEPLPFTPQPDAFPWADEHPLMPSAQTLTEKTRALPTVPEPQPEPFATASALEAHDFAHEPMVEPPFEPVLPAEPVAEIEPAPADLLEQAALQRPTALVDPLRALLAGQAAPVDRVGGPLEKLGVVQLAERLARSLQRRGDAGKPPAEFAARLQEQPEGEPTPHFDGPTAETVPPPALRPSAHELEEFGEEEEDDFAADSYSSLLSIRGAGAPDPAVRAFDAPPEAAQPAKPRLDPAETDRALRSALATLQRMSGAA